MSDFIIVKREIISYFVLPGVSQFISKNTMLKKKKPENQDGGVGRHTAPPRTTRTDRESNSKGDQHKGNRK